MIESEFTQGCPICHQAWIQIDPSECRKYLDDKYASTLDTVYRCPNLEQCKLIAYLDKSDLMIKKSFNNKDAIYWFVDGSCQAWYRGKPREISFVLPYQITLERLINLLAFL